MGFSAGGPVLWEDDAALRMDFDRIALTGAKWVRVDADWSAIEGSPGGWYWASTDRLVWSARARGLDVVLVPTYTPQWARRASCAASRYCPPADPNSFANFVYTTVARYAPFGVHNYEIWNEPNWGPWWASGPNAFDYVTLLKPAYLKAHAADRFVRVISGGLAPHGDLNSDPHDPFNPVNFLSTMYAAGARGFFDAFGVHPYPPLPLAPTTGSIGWNSLLQVDWQHLIMAAHGDGAKQIWGTEYGAPTGSTDPKRVTGAQQAQYIADGLRWWVARPYTGPLFIQTIRDGQADNPGDWSRSMGLLQSNFAPKLSYSVLTTLLH